jgi:hypothetical protein
MRNPRGIDEPAAVNAKGMPLQIAQEKGPPTLAPERLGNTPMAVGEPWSAG